MRWIVLVALLGLCDAAQGQDRAFETLDVYVSGTANVYENFLHEFWSLGQGGQLVVTTPFYFGDVAVGGSYHRYTAEAASVPPFDGLFAFVGWEMPWQPNPRLRLAAGARLGNYRMAFDDPNAEFAGIRNESEFSVAAHARVQFYLTRRLALNASGNYQKTYTFFRLKLWYAAVGLSYQLDTPNWLKRVLR